MKKQNISGNLLCVFLCIISGILGIISMLSGTDVELKQFLKFIGKGILFWGILEICILLITLILNKVYKKNIDSEDSQKFAIPYFICNVGTLIVITLKTQESISILGIIIVALLYDFIPIMITYSIGCSNLSMYNSKGTADVGTLSNPTKNESSIKTNNIYDKFGKKIGSATTYSDGTTGVKKTFVTDKLGNTVAESTSMDDYTTTKVNTTGKF